MICFCILNNLKYVYSLFGTLAAVVAFVVVVVVHGSQSARSTASDIS